MLKGAAADQWSATAQRLRDAGVDALGSAVPRGAGARHKSMRRTTLVSLDALSKALKRR